MGWVYCGAYPKPRCFPLHGTPVWSGTPAASGGAGRYWGWSTLSPEQECGVHLAPCGWTWRGTSTWSSGTGVLVRPSSPCHQSHDSTASHSSSIVFGLFFSFSFWLVAQPILYVSMLPERSIWQQCLSVPTHTRSSRLRHMCVF